MPAPRRVLIKYGGAPLADPATRARLMTDLAAVRATGAEVLVVHGGGPQASALARELGHEPHFVAGRRVTDEGMLRAVQLAICGQVNTDLLAAALAAGLPALGTSASFGGFVTAVRRPPRQVPGATAPVDFGLVADIDSVNPAVVQRAWAAGFVPLLACVVATARGELLNLNADTLVRSIATAMPFTDVFWVADVPGVFADLTDPRTHLPTVRASEIPGLIADGTVAGGMIAKLDEMAQVVRATGCRAWIVGHKEPSPVLRALTGGEGRRTEVTAA